MRNNLLLAMCIGALVLPLASCNDPQDTVPAEQSYGASPRRCRRRRRSLDTDRQYRHRQQLARQAPSPPPPTAWPSMPSRPGSDHPRTVYVLPNGDVLVAESNAPPQAGRRQRHQRLRSRRLCMSRAGAGVPSANRITLLRDADGDGVAETRSMFLERTELAVRHGAGRR